MLGPALGGIAYDWKLSEGTTSIFGLTPFSSAAMISLSLALINWFWVYKFFKETLTTRATPETSQAKPAIFSFEPSRESLGQDYLYGSPVLYDFI